MCLSRLGRAMGALVLTVAGCLMWSGPAHAHTALLRSDPPNGAVLAAAPDRITLEFSGPLMDIGTVVVLRDAEDDIVARSTPPGRGTLVTSEVPAGLPSGKYSIVWRVVSSDGHPVQGVIGFSVGRPSETSADADPVRKPRSRSPGWTPWLAAALGLVLAAALGVMVARRHRSH